MNAEKTWTYHFNQGKKQLESKEYATAIKEFEKAIAFHPMAKYPPATFYKAYCLSLLGNRELAIQYYENAEQDSPEGNFPEASLAKASCFEELEKYNEAVIAYTKAEQDSPESKYPDASYYKGVCYKELKRYDEAIQSLRKAEEDSPEGKHPDASFEKAGCFGELKKYDDEIQAYTKSQQDSPEGKCPNASYNIACRFEDLGKFDEAIWAYTVAERDSYGGKFPDASYNKSCCLFKLGKYDEAAQSCTKAEQDSLGETYPEASYNKAVCLIELRKFDEAIQSCTKAEQDSLGGIYPEASYNKAVCLIELRKIDEAIQSCIKAEQDSYDGKYPDASYNKGVCYRALKRYDEAIQSLRKAEQDSPDGKDPRASHARAAVCSIVGWKEEAISACQKAEEGSTGGEFAEASLLKADCLFDMDLCEIAILACEQAASASPFGIYPEAAYLKGIIHSNLAEYDLAIDSLKQSISESKENHFPSAHVELAKVYWIKNNHLLAKAHAFQALSQDNLHYVSVNFIKENIAATTYLVEAYRNRLEFLYLNNQEKHSDPAFQDLHKKVIPTESDDNTLSLFCSLLVSKELDMPLRIDFQHRLRLAYLIYYSMDQPWYTFYIIKNFLANNCSLDAMDRLFYFYSAYQIAEPYSVLASISSVQNSDSNNDCAIELEKINKRLDSARATGSYHDPYLIKIELQKNPLTGIDIEKLKYHPLIIEALNSVSDSQINYSVPLSRNVLIGLEAQLLINFGKPPQEFDDDVDWQNFLLSIHAEQLSYNLIVNNLRKVITKGIDYTAVIGILFKRYREINDDLIKKNIAILQVCALLSNHMDHKRCPIYKDTNTQVFSGCIIDLLAHESIAAFVTCGVIANFGIGVAAAYLSMKAFAFLVDKWDKEKVDEVFENILVDIEQ